MLKNKFLTVLLSLAISFGLWLYVVTVISPESEATFYNVAVEVVGTDYLDAHGLILISDTKDLKMDLKLRGNRSDLNKLSSSNITIIADLSKITRDGEHQVDCVISFQSGTAEVVEQTPQYITVVVAEQESKTVPVKVIYAGAVRDGYEVDKDMTTMDHTTVTIKGPKDTIEKIAYAGITVDMSDRMTSFVGDYSLTLYGANSLPLVNDQFVSMNVTEVSAVVQVYRVKKLNLQYVLDFTDSGLREDMVTVTATKDVTLVGSDDALAKLDEQFRNGQFSFTIKLSAYNETTTETLSLPLPDGVICKEEIKAYIQIPKLTSKTLILNADQYTFDNRAQNLNVEVNGPVEIVIWGLEDELLGITAEDVVATVDCTEITADSVVAPVRYTVSGHEYMRVEQKTVAITVQTLEG